MGRGSEGGVVGEMRGWGWDRVGKKMKRALLRGKVEVGVES